MNLLVLLLLAQTMNLNKVPVQKVIGTDGGAVPISLPFSASGAFGEVPGDGVEHFVLLAGQHTAQAA